MGNEKDSKPAAPPAATATASQTTNLSILTDAQFERYLKAHARATIYAGIATGVVFAKPGVTPTPANLKTIKDLAEAVLALMEGGK